MPTCTACGRESPAGFRFCGACGAPLPETPAVREVRKVVTIVFCDLAGSTALGDRTDPEALRATMRGYYDQMRTILERHGGTVEKFIGDAVMAVFGVPVSHEDDALRAVRAAWEMREAVDRLQLEARIGVNTGEVVAGDGDSLVTGDAVNVAARLEQAAGTNDVLIGDATRSLVRDAVRVEPVTVQAKGKAEPIEAFRLVDLDAGAAAVARRFDSPLVGRKQERDRLAAGFEHAARERTCHLFTLLGPAGVGKSRLTQEFLRGLSAPVVTGRCLHYGEGITYWPLVEIVMQLGDDPQSVLGTSPGETQLSFRRLLEHHAADAPLVVVIDDLQWAEPTFLDLVEHVADWTRDAPIFLLCIARPELLDLRPTWGGGKLNATSVLLEPLGEAEIDVLLDNLLGGGELSAELRSRIVGSAQGNPLFVEELTAMVRDGGADAAAIPSTIQALLQSRLDRLGEAERAVLERGAVEGEVFHHHVVAELAPAGARHDVPERLLSLVRKELIRPVAATFPDDDAFRFRHLLIRDTAYDGLPKATRADLHERFAHWLDEHVQLLEQHEIVAYHLEQAARYRSQLGTPDPALERAAAQRLTAAGVVAGGRRGDVNAAIAFYRRALVLQQSGDERNATAFRLYVFVSESDIPEAAAIVEAMGTETASQRAYRALAETDLAFNLGDGSRLRLEQAISDGNDVFRATGDLFGLAAAARQRGYADWLTCDYGAAHVSFTTAYEAALSANEVAFAEEALALAAAALFFTTSVSATDALAQIGAMRSRAHAGPLLTAYLDRAVGGLISLSGDAERAREMFARANATVLEAGLLLSAAGSGQALARTERLGGNIEEAARILGEACRELEQLGARAFLGTTQMYHVALLIDLGRIDEAAQVLEEAAPGLNQDDVMDVAMLALDKGRIALARTDLAEAQRQIAASAKHGAAIDDWEFTTSLALAEGDLARALGDEPGARVAYERARAIADRKGIPPLIAEAEQRLATLEPR